MLYIRHCSSLGCLSGRNLLRSLNRCKISKKSCNISNSNAIKLLRDIYEHWDEQKEAFQEKKALIKSGKKFSDKYPNGKPWSIAYSPNGFVIGNILNLYELLRDLNAMEEFFLTHVSNME